MMNKIRIGFEFDNAQSVGWFLLLMVISLIIAMCSNRTKMLRCALIGTVIYATVVPSWLVGTGQWPQGDFPLWLYIYFVALLILQVVWFPVGIVAIFKSAGQKIVKTQEQLLAEQQAARDAVRHFGETILISVAIVVALFVVLGIAAICHVH